jgi:hypothetical protein
MLINKIGVETDDEVTPLDSRREPTDPRNRETTTMLLRVALSAVKRSELLGPAVDAVTTPVATLTPAASSPRPQVATADDSRTDAA